MKLQHWTGELKKLRKLHQKEAEDWGLDDQDSDSEDGMSDDGDDSDDGAEEGGDAAEKETGVEESKGGEGKQQEEEDEDEQPGEQASEVSVWLEIELNTLTALYNKRF